MSDYNVRSKCSAIIDGLVRSPLTSTVVDIIIGKMESAEMEDSLLGILKLTDLVDMGIPLAHAIVLKRIGYEQSQNNECEQSTSGSSSHIQHDTPIVATGMVEVTPLQHTSVQNRLNVSCIRYQFADNILRKII